MNASFFGGAKSLTEQGLHRSHRLCFLHVAALLSCNENEIWREKNILIEFVVPIESSMKLINFFSFAPFAVKWKIDSIFVDVVVGACKASKLQSRVPQLKSLFSR